MKLICVEVQYPTKFLALPMGMLQDNSIGRSCLSCAFVWIRKLKCVEIQCKQSGLKWLTSHRAHV